MAGIQKTQNGEEDETRKIGTSQTFIVSEILQYSPNWSPSPVSVITSSPFFFQLCLQCFFCNTNLLMSLAYLKSFNVPHQSKIIFKLSNIAYEALRDLNHSVFHPTSAMLTLEIIISRNTLFPPNLGGVCVCVFGLFFFLFANTFLP